MINIISWLRIKYKEKRYHLDHFSTLGNTTSRQSAEFKQLINKYTEDVMMNDS